MKDPLSHWVDALAGFESPDVLLTGVAVWEASVNPDRRVHAPHANWFGTDIVEQSGVDVVADLHEIHRKTHLKFDGIFSPSVLEHLERPWVAMQSMSNCLRSGGYLFVQTHQTFPLHYYPDDHFRFTTSALTTMAVDAGLEVVATGYDHPCMIQPPRSVTVWNKAAESFLNVTICARKP